MLKINKFAAAVAATLSFSALNTYAAYDPIPVAKSTSNKVYAHIMPWFESKEFSGYWGGHWTMANKNPDAIDSSGRREIASYYYPAIGPYASADPDVIEYQLLLMKFSGIDGVLIDWPGTTNSLDYVRNRQNSEAIISRVGKVGLDFAVVYEDNNLTLANVPDKLGQARKDMAYLRDNYFNNSHYIKVNNQPLLLDFGPQTIQSNSDWSYVFSVLPSKPYFLTLWYEHGDAGANSQGEFAWIYQDATPYLTHLSNFYQNATNYGLKMGVAAPGFNAFYAAGGWGANTFVIDHRGLGTFKDTLNLALSQGSSRIQLATWNDYGEGTTIEPTREYGYSYLTYLQQALGVSGLAQTDLELVNELFNQRKKYKGNDIEQARLDNVFNYMVSLQLSAAKNLLIGSSAAKTIRIINRWKNTYLCDGGDYVVYSTSSGGNLCQWVVENVANGKFELRNLATSHYMNIENLTGKVQATNRNSDWESSKWVIETVDATYSRVRSSWRSAQYINVENQNSYAQSGTINNSWLSAQWKFETVR